MNYHTAAAQTGGTNFQVIQRQVAQKESFKITNSTDAQRLQDLNLLKSTITKQIPKIILSTIKQQKIMTQAPCPIF